MLLEYSIEEKIDESKKGVYVPLKVKIHQDGSPNFKHGKAWELLISDHDLNWRLERNYPVYLVSFIQHTGTDESNREFFTEKEARNYISALGRAINQRQKVDKVHVHNNQGEKNLFILLSDLPVNTYTSFKTPTDTFSITLSKL